MSIKKIIKNYLISIEYTNQEIEAALQEIEEKGYFRIEDFSCFESGKSCDGGHYGFWTNAHIIEEDGFIFLEFEERTTCDAFAFCPHCGKFTDHKNNLRECKPKRFCIFNPHID